MKSKNLKKSTENLTKIATKNWQIIPEELQMALKNHVEILNSYFTDIIINPDLKFRQVGIYRLAIVLIVSD